MEQRRVTIYRVYAWNGKVQVAETSARKTDKSYLLDERLDGFRYKMRLTHTEASESRREAVQKFVSHWEQRVQTLRQQVDRAQAILDQAWKL